MNITRKQLRQLILKEAKSDSQQKLIQKLKPLVNNIVSLNSNLKNIEDMDIQESLTVLSQSLLDLMTVLIDRQSNN